MSAVTFVAVTASPAIVIVPVTAGVRPTASFFTSSRGELLLHPVADVHVLARRDDPGAVGRGPIARGRVAVGGREAGLGRRIVGEHVPRDEAGSGQDDDREREEDEAERRTEHALRS